MKPVRMMLAASLVAGLSGCSNLHQSLMFRPATDRATVARGEVDSGPPDLFHRPSETASARMSRYFPGLTRWDRPAKSPTSEGVSRGSGNPDLRAVPREPAADGEATAAAGRPRSYRSPTARQLEFAARREEPARRPEPEPMPLLAAAVVAETDPSDVAREPSGLPELTPAEQALRAARVAGMTSGNHLSVRRMPPMPDVNVAAGRQTPALAARPAGSRASRLATRDEDSQARQVRTRVEDAPAPSEAKPVVATAAEPVTARSLSLAPPADDPGPQPVAEPAPPDDLEHAVAAKPPIAAESPKANPAEAEDEGPPAIESRPAPIPTQAKAAVDPDTGGDPTLVGRPRLAQVQPIRDHVPPDLPAVSYPRSYYAPGVLARLTPRPKVDPEARPARWTWTPKLLRRLRGEVAADAVSEKVRSDKAPAH